MAETRMYFPFSYFGARTTGGSAFVAWASLFVILSFVPRQSFAADLLQHMPPTPSAAPTLLQSAAAHQFPHGWNQAYRSRHITHLSENAMSV